MDERDKNGELAGSGDGIPAFVAPQDKAVTQIIQKFHTPGAVEAGDIFIVTDPFSGGVSHLEVSVG